MNQFNTLLLPIAILISSIIFGGFFYASEANKQRSIERQQAIKLKEEKEAKKLKAEQEKKEYTANRKKDCLSIYKTESDKWNNVRGWRYLESNDTCFIRYKEANPKSEKQCDEDYPVNGKLGFIFSRDNALCKEGEFENNF